MGVSIARQANADEYQSHTTSSYNRESRREAHPTWTITIPSVYNFAEVYKVYIALASDCSFHLSIKNLDRIIQTIRWWKHEELSRLSLVPKIKARVSCKKWGPICYLNRLFVVSARSLECGLSIKIGDDLPHSRLVEANAKWYSTQWRYYFHSLNLMHLFEMIPMTFPATSLALRQKLDRLLSRMWFTHSSTIIAKLPHQWRFASLDAIKVWLPPL